MRLFAEDSEVRPRLEEIGLSPEGLERVAAVGGGGHNSATSFHPSFAPGTFLYHEATAALRRYLVPKGWLFDEVDQQPRTYNEDLGIAIVVQTGDELTGSIGALEPTTKNPKGSATRKKIAVNVQLELFPTVKTVSPEQGLQTWVLLLAVVDGELRAELSLPERMSEGSKPCGWVERILLGAQPIGGPPNLSFANPDDGGPNTDFDVAWQQ